MHASTSLKPTPQALWLHRKNAAAIKCSMPVERCVDRVKADRYM
jgi:hypothetical protein